MDLASHQSRITGPAGVSRDRVQLVSVDAIIMLQISTTSLLRFSQRSLRRMPATRSETRAANNSKPLSADVDPQLKTQARKRKASTAAKAPSKKPRSDVAVDASSANPKVAESLPVSSPAAGAPLAVVPAALSFSFEDAKEHLIEADERFQDVFERNQCKPFEVLDRVEPFRSLVVSIL